MMTWEMLDKAADIGSTVALVVVCLACVMHLATNVTAASAECERWGFVLTGAGSFGVAVYMWWPTIEGFPFALVMHAGMALIALSIIRGRIRDWLIRHGATVFDRRRTPDPAAAITTGAFIAQRFERRE